MPTSSPAAGNLADFANKPIGTGPFTFVDYQTDAVIRYKAIPDYWAGKVAIDDLIFAITTDATVRVQKLQGRRMRRHGLSRTRPTSPALKADTNLDGAGAGRPQHRLHVLQHHGQPPIDNVKSARRSTWPSTSRRSIDAVYQGAGQVGQEPDPADHVVL